MTSKLKQSKILYIVKTMDIGGAERFTLNLCKYFKDRTASVTVASSGGIFVPQLEQYGINHIKLKNQPVIKNIIPLYKELKSIVKENNYSIVHSQHRIFTFILQLFINKRFVLLYTAHNFFTDLFQKFIFPDFAVAISTTIYENLKSSSLINKNKISKINIGIDIPESYITNVGPVTLGFIGRLINEKGIFNLLESVKILSSENLNFKLIIRGNGDLEKIKSFINQNNLSSLISIAPPSFDEEVIYKDINVLVLPTTLNEGLPISILEAAARRILIVSAQAGGIRDFLKDGQTGVMLSSVDPKTIADKLKEIILNYNSYLPLIDNAFLKVKHEYSLELMNKEYEILYNSILETVLL